MPSKKTYARIAITLPKQDLAAADRLARTHDRSRSWIVAEAIRRYVASAITPMPQVQSSRRAADERTLASPLGVSALSASRLAQLQRDLSLSPEARVRAAEETLLLTEKRKASPTHQVVAFDRYEDFLDWKRLRAPHQ